MNRLHFSKPSIWRVFWATVAVAAAGSVLAGVGLFTGAIAVSKADPRIVYMATGDGTNTTSSFYGRGVFKSTNSGKT